MLNKLFAFVRQYDMLQPGDRVVCAVSGGADSVALLFALYLLREKLNICLSAAHFNHRLRGEESDRDEAFVRQFCSQYDIALTVGSGVVLAGKKGLEAAAREARYAFLKTLPGKIATAHTANDNAETVLMHMVRGTGLKGLGGIAPVNGLLIRPMLRITRQEVLSFLEEYNLPHITDSTNDTDAFLRNRLRHRVMPILEQENPRLAENLSATALRLREDEAALALISQAETMPDVMTLRQMPAAQRNRMISAFLEKNGVREPEAEHIGLVEKLIFSEKPSARADLPGGVCVTRSYNRLEVNSKRASLDTVKLVCPGSTNLPELGLQVICAYTDVPENTPDCFTVIPEGEMVLRSRQTGDTIRLPGGTKELKKLFIDRKIPAANRLRIPVLADKRGVLGVYGIGANRDRLADQSGMVQIKFEKL